MLCTYVHYPVEHDAKGWFHRPLAAPVGLQEDYPAMEEMQVFVVVQHLQTQEDY